MSEIQKRQKVYSPKNENFHDTWVNTKEVETDNEIKIKSYQQKENPKTTDLGCLDMDIECNTLGVILEGTSDVEDIAAKREEKEKDATAEAIRFKENISSISEKFNTTLVEIHKQKSKRLAEIFGEIHAKLGRLKSQKRQFNQRCYSKLCNGVLQLIAESFLEMEMRSHELDKQFMSELKDDTNKNIREDCENKKAMIRILQENVQADMDMMSEDP